ncbi:hypothetical protein HMPREF0083_01698 [Aneurinibacillus aneurinilyticus ATCC 12856]|uniref:Uncharacterized protein n=1 Tax=Aneurinibacillus aneurinilyticus ATCC 12856 TaxID=649747 RepID=U1YHF4_ANEAE|nr:hypothetical protein HMPREF0083_01698 [Aneurinibacillus aneurinilyticus ATCC 12856]
MPSTHIHQVKNTILKEKRALSFFLYRAFCKNLSPWGTRFSRHKKGTSPQLVEVFR